MDGIVMKSTQVQKASGELLHSQQRKHLHPADGKKLKQVDEIPNYHSAFKRLHLYISRLSEERSYVKTISKPAYLCILLNINCKTGIRKQCLIRWQLKQAFLLSSQKLSAKSRKLRLRLHILTTSAKRSKVVRDPGTGDLTCHI